MRNILIPIAAAVSTIAFAAPAAAQYWPAPAPQGHGYGYGYGYGHNDNYGQVRRLEARVHQLRQRIRQLDHMGRLSNREARRLDYHAAGLQHRIAMAARHGLNWRERDEIGRRLEALRHAIRYESRDGNRWGWNGYDRNDNGYGYYNQRRGSDGRHRDDDRWDRDDDDHDDDDRRGRRGERDDD